MKKKLVGLLLFVGLFSISNAKTVYCKNFDTQAEAQRYFKTHNAKRLDGDKDGEACECLKGGSSYDKSVCKRWRAKNNKR